MQIVQPRHGHKTIWLIDIGAALAIAPFAEHLVATPDELATGESVGFGEATVECVIAVSGALFGVAVMGFAAGY